MSRILYRAILGLAVVAAYPAVARDILVTTLDDAPGIGVVSGGQAGNEVTTLREAIELANASAGEDHIRFSVAGTIRVGAALPALSDPTGGTTIDGERNITLDGSMLDIATDALRLTTAENQIRGLTIIHFPGNGVRISGDAAVGNIIENCKIGTDGARRLPNEKNGVYVGDGVTGTRIGGDLAYAGNTISGNDLCGIVLSPGSSRSTVLGNMIGTDETGSYTVANGVFPDRPLEAFGYGVYIRKSSLNVIGGPDAGNVISGNYNMGVLVSSPESTHNVIQGNRIGTTADTRFALVNGNNPVADGLGLTFFGGWGIWVTQGAFNQIGGPSAGEGNVISGNHFWAISTGGQSTTIQGNRIVTDLVSDTGLLEEHMTAGIYLVNSNETIIGGARTGSGNTIDGYWGAFGIAIISSIPGSATNIVVQNNDLTAGPAFPDFGSPGIGIYVGASSKNTIGGREAGAGNRIEGRQGYGIYLGNGAAANSIVGNSITGNGRAAIAIGNSSNQSITAPQVSLGSVVCGVGAPCGLVDIYADASDEAKYFLDTLEVDRCGVFAGHVSLTPYIGLNLTATVTDEAGNTSELSAPIPITAEALMNEGEGSTDGEGSSTVLQGEESCFCTPPIHSADVNKDNVLGLSELLRTIQLFSLVEFHCSATDEDGYGAGSGDRSCPPHTSDYDPQDWNVSINELLRTIQFFNSGGYTFCPAANTEDGYCPAA